MNENITHDCQADEQSYSVGLLTVSDSCFNKTKNDGSGDHLYDLLSKGEIFPAKKIIYRKIIPDDISFIEEALTSWTDVAHLDMILTIGGTGFSPRDVTPEATRNISEREAPGLAANMICMCSKDMPFSLLSRATCGIRGQTLILNLPGSVKGSYECFQKAAKILPHAIDQLKKDYGKVDKTHLEISLQRSHASSWKDFEDCKKGWMCKPVKKRPLSGNGEAEPHKKCHSSGVPSKSKVVDSNVANRPRESPYPLKSVQQALDIVLEEGVLLETEFKSLDECFNRVSAADVRSLLSSPPYPTSTRDGYAVYAADKSGSRVVQGSLTAGDCPTNSVLEPGKCVRISTGSPLPLRADAVVQVEDTSLLQVDKQSNEELQILIQAKPKIGENIRTTGSDVQKGQKILSKNKCITPFNTGLLAASGLVNFLVYRSPIVAMLSTGSELVKPGSSLKPGCIIDSNKTSLRMMLHELNFKTFDAGIAIDSPDDLKNHLELALTNSDVVVVTGGVSMGEKDYLKEVLKVDFSAHIHFGRVFMKPGKPTTFASLMFKSRSKLVFGLPGNPVSAIVTFHLFVVPCLRKMMGHMYPKQVIIKAKLEHTLLLDSRPEYHRAVVNWYPHEKVPLAKSTGNQMSSRLLSMVNSNALMILPPATQSMSVIEKGSFIDVLLLNVFPVIEINSASIP